MTNEGDDSDGLDFVASGESGDSASDPDSASASDSASDSASAPQKKRKRKRRSPSKSKGKGKGKGKPKPSGVRAFIDDEASGSSSSEEGSGFGSKPKSRGGGSSRQYTAAEVAAEQLDSSALALIRDQDRRRERDGRFDGESDDKKVAEEIVKRHRSAARPNANANAKSANASANAGGSYAYGRSIGVNWGSNLRDNEVSQQSLQPSVNDPTVWMFGCKIGKEEELAVTLMNKAIALYRDSGGEGGLGITAVAAGKSKGERRGEERRGEERRGKERKAPRG